MNVDLPITPQSALAYISTAFVGVLWWIFRGHAKDLRNVSKDLQTVKENYVSRKDLADAIAAADARTLLFEQRQLAMHTANTDNFRELRLQLESVNSKLFELAKDKPVP